MIIEDQLEQLAIQWFKDTGWKHVHGAVIAPEGVAAEREALGTLSPALCLRPSPLRSGSHGEREEDGRLAEAVRRLNPKQGPSSRPSPTGKRRMTVVEEVTR